MKRPVNYESIREEHIEIAFDDGGVDGLPLWSLRHAFDAGYDAGMSWGSKSELTQLRTDLGQAREHIEELSSLIADIKLDRDKKFSELADELGTLEAENTQLRAELQSVGSTMEQAIDKAGALEDELTQLRTDRDEYKARAEGKAYPFVTMAKYDRDTERLRRVLAQVRIECGRWKTWCLTSEASEEDAQKAAAQLRTERERLLEYLGRIRPLAKSIALISEADEDVKDMADSIWTITLAALAAGEVTK